MSRTNYFESLLYQAITDFINQNGISKTGKL